MKKLDALRGIAILGVMLVHSYGLFLNREESSSAISAISQILSAGRFGVELFFLLSGFLIAWLYEEKQGRREITKFAVHRFARIWPLWAIFSIAWFCVFLALGEIRLADLALSLSFLLWLSPTAFDSFIGGAWSIQIEVLCYLLFILTRNWTANRLVALAICINILGILVSFSDLTGEGVIESIRRLSFQTGFNFFLLGWLLARFSRTEKKSEVHLRILNFKAISPFLMILWIFSFLFTPAIYGNPIEATGFVLISILIVAFFSEESLLNRFLAFFGKYSYFLFFAHFMFLFVIQHNIGQWGFVVNNQWLALAGGLAIWVGMSLLLSPLAILSMKLFEKPIMQIARKI